MIAGFSQGQSYSRSKQTSSYRQEIIIAIRDFAFINRFYPGNVHYDPATLQIALFRPGKKTNIGYDFLRQLATVTRPTPL